ncbi:MAG TPA: DUF6151 family protein [Tahibacter sp.]|uniref:DUF6151 family protein n=1 Tax=Tahibacter sp. TaxID=2056211 RepID=UPI002C45EE7A|nr:DUF6151 family protein [Tahibacter sp.]HSX59447.1 DUF6151 family protein [Tahibacter sp.]
MTFPVRCRCGTLEGTLANPQRAARAACYCRDCQAYARFLGKPELTLDAKGGTDIVATRPDFLTFTRGADQLRCVSLSDKGLLRWYADCCNTPIGNTPRDAKFPYVGLVHDCLAGSDSERDAAFGPARTALNTGSASGEVKAPRLPLVLGILRIMRNVFSAKLSGAYRRNPFFDVQAGTPVATPRILTEDERKTFGANVAKS